MPGEVRRSPSSLAAKLDKLFQAVRPGGRGEYSYQEVADAILGSAEISAAHASASAFVQALYQDVLGRTGSAAEVAGAAISAL